MPKPKFTKEDVVVSDFHACCGMVPQWKIVGDPEYKIEESHKGYWYKVKFLGCLTGDIRSEIDDESEFPENRLISLVDGKEMAGKYLEARKTVFQEQWKAFAGPLENLSDAQEMANQLCTFDPEDVARKKAIAELFVVFGNTRSFIENKLQNCIRELQQLQE